MLVFVDVGFRIGRRRHASSPETSIEVIGTVDAAVFGLLGLIVAFAFNGASDRLVVRRAQIVEEANAIGTAYLRLELLPKSEQPHLQELFRRYLDLRIEVFDNILDPPVSNAALLKSEDLQRQIWSGSVAACQAVPNPDPCLLLLPALNNMIDIGTTRTMAVYTHAPSVIIVILLTLSLIAAMISGFAMARQMQRSLLHMLLFSLVISMAVYIVLDLEFPRTGLINLESMDKVLYQLRETMK
jgi:hypothetical protein